MDVKEASILIGILKKENETNTPTEKKFNTKWLKCLYKSFANSLNRSL